MRLEFEGQITDYRTRQESLSNVRLEFGGHITHYRTRQESSSSVFGIKSLILKQDKNHRQVCVWGQITECKKNPRIIVKCAFWK